MEIQKFLSRDDRRKILNVTIDNAARSALFGMGVGGVFGILLRSRYVFLFAVAYSVGNSLSKSNQYLLDHLKV